MVVGITKFPPPPPPNGVYKGCVLGKHHHAPFESIKVWQEKNLLKLVQSDLCCINLPSLAGARYILNFIDDLSHFTWVYFLETRILSLKSSKNSGPLLKITMVDPSSA
jgi:hypothetical protein